MKKIIYETKTKNSEPSAKNPKIKQNEVWQGCKAKHVKEKLIRDKYTATCIFSSHSCYSKSNFFFSSFNFQARHIESWHLYTEMLARRT